MQSDDRLVINVDNIKLAEATTKVDAHAERLSAIERRLDSVTKQVLVCYVVLSIAGGGFGFLVLKTWDLASLTEKVSLLEKVSEPAKLRDLVFSKSREAANEATTSLQERMSVLEEQNSALKLELSRTKQALSLLSKQPQEDAPIPTHATKSPSNPQQEPVCSGTFCVVAPSGANRRANVRTKPDSRSSTLCTSYQGSRLQVFGTSFDSGGAPWHKVFCDKAKGFGWIADKDLERLPLH
jgi:hypothetical protein